MTTILDCYQSLLQDWGKRAVIIQKIYIFGSYAKGTAHSDSDLDLAICADQLPGDSGATTIHFERRSWETELSKLLGIAVDVEELTDRHVNQFVGEASKLIYCRDD